MTCRFKVLPFALALAAMGSARADVSISGNVYAEFISQQYDTNLFSVANGPTSGFAAMSLGTNFSGVFTVDGFSSLDLNSSAVGGSSSLEDLSGSEMLATFAQYGFAPNWNTSLSGSLDSSNGTAFEYMSNATFATFATFSGMSADFVAYDYSQLKSKSLTSPSINLEWYNPAGQQLYVSYETSSSPSDSSQSNTTVLLRDTHGTAYYPQIEDGVIKGGVTLVFAEGSSILSYISPLNATQVKGISGSGDFFIVSNDRSGIDYFGSLSSNIKKSISANANYLRLQDISFNGDVAVAYDYSRSGLLTMSLTDGFEYNEVSTAIVVKDDGTLINIPNYLYSVSFYTADYGNNPILNSYNSFSSDLSPTAISGDGSTVIGSSSGVDMAALAIGDLTNALRSNKDSFIWDETNGTRLLDIASSTAIYANAINYDGSVIVGAVDNVNGTEAFKWDGGNTLLLGDLSGGRYYSAATAVNNDGSIVAGFSDVGSTSNGVLFEAFRWTATGGIVGLGRPSSSEGSIAIDISGDGNVIVGTMGNLGNKTLNAFRWTASNGMQKVTEWLAATGVSVPADLVLEAATVVNNDGAAIGGTSNGKAWLAYSGRGVIYPDEVASTLVVPSALVDFNIDLTSLSFEGVHHRPLKTMSLTSNECFWLNGDLSDNQSSESKTTVAEVGACSDINETLRFGIGLGKSNFSKEIFNTIDTSLNGKYIYAELGYEPENSGVVLSASAITGQWDSSIKRSYLNMGVYDSSVGKPDLTSTSLKLRADMLNAFSFGDFSVSPSASITRTEVKIDPYEEVGGGFPANLNQQKQYINDLRIGLSAEKKLNIGNLRLLADHYKEIDRSTNGINGSLIGKEFSFENNNPKSDRTRLGAELDIDLGNEWMFSGLVSLSDTRNTEDKLFAISFKRSLQ